MNTTATNTFQGKTADEWKAMAAHNRARSQESYDRCDTDGFLSQWAADQMAAKYHKCADIAADGGTLTVAALFHNGTPTTARLISGRYGLAWALDNDNGTTSWFNESSAKSPATRRANFTKKYPGYTLGLIRVNAGLDKGSGDPYPIRDQIVEVVTSDADTDGDDYCY